MNKVVLVGRLTDDPTGNDKYMKYCLAVKKKYAQDGKPDADFINVVCFGKQADFVWRYLKKGMRIGICGRIQTGSFTAQDGTTRHTTEIVAEEHEFLESKSESRINQASEPKQMDMYGWQTQDEDDLPFN